LNLHNDFFKYFPIFCGVYKNAFYSENISILFPQCFFLGFTTLSKQIDKDDMGAPNGSRHTDPEQRRGKTEKQSDKTAAAQSGKRAKIIIVI